MKDSAEKRTDIIFSSSVYYFYYYLFPRCSESGLNSLKS